MQLFSDIRILRILRLPMQSIKSALDCSLKKLWSFRFYLLAVLTLVLLSIFTLALDRSAIEAIRSSPTDNILIRKLLTPVKPLGKADVLVFIAFLIGFGGLRRRAAQILTALLIVLVLVWPVKLVVNRDRPNHRAHFSYPSGDAAAAAAFIIPLAAQNPVLLPIGIVVAGSVAAGRVFNNAHYPSDVIGGLAFGILAGVLAMVLWGRRKVPLGRYHFALLAFFFIGARLPLGFLTKNGTEFLLFLKILGPVLLIWLFARYARIEWKKKFIRSYVEIHLKPAQISAIALTLALLLILAVLLFAAGRIERCGIEMSSASHITSPGSLSQRFQRNIK